MDIETKIVEFALRERLLEGSADSYDLTIFVANILPGPDRVAFWPPIEKALERIGAKRNGNLWTLE